MQTQVSLQSQVRRIRIRRCARCLAALIATALLGAGVLHAQAPGSKPTPPAAHKAVHSRAHSKKAKAGPPAAPETPPQPPAPDWPINDQPTPAYITWDSQGLSIRAANSSLSQILTDVATATGAKVEGMGTDQRIFGTYGPGLARDVVSQLLHGTGYNVLLIGDQGQGTPRQIVLSTRGSGGSSTHPAANAQQASEDDAAENEPEEPPQPQPQPPVMRPGFNQGAPIRPPQMLPDMQQTQMPPNNQPNPQF